MQLFCAYGVELFLRAGQQVRKLINAWLCIYSLREKVHTHSLVENMKMHTEKGDIYTFAHKNS